MAKTVRLQPSPGGRLHNTHTLVLPRRLSVRFTGTEIKVRLCDRAGKGTDMCRNFPYLNVNLSVVNYWAPKFLGDRGYGGRLVSAITARAARFLAAEASTGRQPVTGWSDEAAFEIGHDGGNRWMTGAPGEEYLDKNLNHSFKRGNRTSRGVGGCFMATILGPLIFSSYRTGLG